jgi:hypothetical protein
LPKRAYGSARPRRFNCGTFVILQYLSGARRIQFRVSRAASSRDEDHRGKGSVFLGYDGSLLMRRTVHARIKVV